MRCPNKNHPDWKALVDKIGFDRAYEEYLKNGEDIPNPDNYKEETTGVNYTLKIVNAILEKGDSHFNRFFKNNPDKFYNDLIQFAGLNQVQFLRSLDPQVDTAAELISFVLANMSYTIGIVTSKDTSTERYDPNVDYSVDEQVPNTQYYSNLTVPGGTNYTENEIRTPNIIPSIKGHAQFSTDQGIGWFRSDEQRSDDNTGKKVPDGAGGLVQLGQVGSKTRRILEVQSDLFQKGRNKEDLITIEQFENPNDVYYQHSETGELITGEDLFFGGYTEEEQSKYKIKPFDNQQNKTLPKNQFLQLLNKDNNWVTFFVQSIIQDSRRKGYEKVLFPTGNTANEVEGQETVEDFIKDKTERLEELQKDIKDFNSNFDKVINDIESQSGFRFEQDGVTYVTGQDSGPGVKRGDRVYRVETPKGTSYVSKEEFFTRYSEAYNSRVLREISQIETEIENARQGRTGFSAIHSFYENTIYNVLRKRYGKENINRIKDEYGNEWYEVDPRKQRSNILLTLEDEVSENLDKTFSDIILPGFTAYTQNEAVNLLMEQVIIQIRLSPVSLNQAMQNVLEELKETDDESFAPIIQNIVALREFVKDKLDRTGLFDREYLIDGNNIDIEGDNVSDSFYWKDDWVFKFDPKANAQKKIKEFLMFIPKTTYSAGEYQYEYNQFNTNSFMPFDEIFEELKAILADVPNNWNSMRERLMEYEESKPWIHSLLVAIDEYPYIQKRITGKEGDREQLINQFVTTFSSTYSGSKTLLWDFFKGEFQFRIIDTDQNSAVKSLLSKWKSYFNDSAFVTTDEEGNVIGDDKVISSFISQLEALEKNPENVNSVLSQLGIDLSEATLEQLVKGQIAGLDFKNQFTSDRGLFKIIKLRLSKKDAKDLEYSDIVNPAINNSTLRELAKVEVENNAAIYSNSYQNGEGNIVYSYSLNKFLTKQLQRFKNEPEYLDKLMQVTFQAPLMVDEQPLYKTWLWEYKNNEQFRAIFDAVPFDSLKQEGDRGTVLSRMGDVEHEITKLLLFQNRNRSIRGAGRVSNYLFTIPSKTTSYVITAGAIDPNLSFQGNDFKLGKQSRNALYSTALTELKRINSIKDRKITTNKYKAGSKYFYFFPILNKETTPEIWNSDNTVKLPTTIINGITVEQIIKDKIESVIKQEIIDKVNYWKSAGIIVDNKLLYVDNKYKSRLKLSDEANNIFAAADYVINNTLAKFNLHQMFIGDPAIYFKNSVAATWDEIGKRLAAMIAPGRELSLSSENEKFISVKVKDRKGPIALNIAELRERLGDQVTAYEDITGTDAQEFTTLKEHITILYKLGQISTEVYNNILNKSKKEGDNLILTPEELGTVLQPMKPVYVQQEIISTEDVVSLEYVKSSSIPLIPQFTQGLELDKVRKALEKLEREQGLTARLAFDSATKVGGVSSVEIFNEDGTIKNNIDFVNHFKVLSRQGFLIQQDVPYDPNEEEVIKSTQATKLLFDGLLDLTGFEHKGQTYTGDALRDRYTELHRKLFEESKEALSKDILGVDGQIDLAKLQPILLNEARLRGYSPADVAALSIKPDGTFEYPFWIGGRKFEALITSLYTNNIVRQQLHGKSYVLVTEEGNLGKSKGVVYTEAYDSTTGLKPMRIENGEVKAAQVLLPWKFKQDISKYITKEGLLDTKAIPKDLLERFAFRIPNQGHNSMALIEVVGFLPAVMGDVVIASRNFIAQMGSDFDVDKLYIYDYYSLPLGDGSNHIIRDDIDNVHAIKNELVDIYKAVLKNPKVFNSIIKPLGNTKDTESAQYLKKILQRKFNNYLSPDYDKLKYLESVDGKNMVSIMALANTLNPMLQRKDFKHTFIAGTIEDNVIEDTVVFGNENKKAIKLSDLSSPFTWRNNTKNYVISSDLSAAVDNEKDPILYYINANPITAPARVALMQLGFEHDHINYLTAQPIIREFVTRVQRSRSIAGQQEFLNDVAILSGLINEVKEKYVSSLSEKDKANYSENNLKYSVITAEELKSNITKRSTLIDLISLLKFNHAYQLGRSLQSIQSTINIESSGVGRSVIELKAKEDKIINILKIKNISNASKILGEFTNKGLTPNTYAGYLLKNSIIEANDKLGDSELFHYNSRVFNHLLGSYSEIIGEITEEKAIDLWDNLKSYIFAQRFTIKERNELFFDKNSLAKRIRKYLKTSEGQRNQFLIRLNLEFKGGSNPDLISYNAAKEEFVDEIAVYQGFLELINHRDENIRKIGEDLVTYFYINGGIQRAREWGRYIHPNFLKIVKNGYLLESFKSVDFQDLNTIGFTSGPYNISSMLLQYIQHKPWLAKTVPQNLIEDKTISVDKDNLVLPPPYMESVINLTRPNSSEFQPVLSVKDSSTSKGYRLYLFDKKKGETVVFKRIPVLGTTNFVEYSNTSIGLSLVNPNFIKKEKSTPAPVKNIPKNDTKSISNTGTIADEYVGPLSQVLPKLKYRKELVNLVKAAKPTATVSVNADIGVPGNYNPDTKTIVINPAFIKKRSEDLRKDVERVVLHETIHDITVSALQSKEGLTAKQRQAVDKIETIFDSLKQRLVENKLEGFSYQEFLEFMDLWKKRKDNKITEKERIRMAALRPKYYGFTMVEEFVTEIFTTEEFQKGVAHIKWDGQKSILDRFIDLITDFLNAVGFAKDSIGAEVIREVVNLIPEEKNERKSWFAKGDAPLETLNTIEDSVDTNYSKLVNEFEARLKFIDDSISKAFNQGDRVRAEQLLARKKEVEEELKSLEEKEVFSTILDIAKKDLDNVQKLLSLPGVSHNDINYTLRVVKTWINAPELVLEQEDIRDENERAQDIYEVQARANRLYKKWELVARASLLKAMRESSGLDNITQEVLDSQDRINSLTANLMDISRTGNTLLSVMDKWMRESMYKANLEANKIHEEVDKLIKNLETNEDFKRDKYYVFAQRTDKGDLTGEIVQPLLSEYFTKRNSLIEDALSEHQKEIRRDKWRNYFKWLRDNHTFIDIRKLFTQENDGTYTYKGDKDYLETLKTKFGEDLDTYLEEQKNKILAYNDRLLTKIESLDKDDPDYFRQLEEWKVQYDPAIYLRNVMANNFSVNIVNGKFIKNEGQEFVFKRAIAKWEDPQYKKIRESAELKAFYEYLAKTLNRLYSYIPSSYKQNITTRNIPSIPRSLLEVFNEEGMSAALTKMNNNFIESISVDDVEQQTRKLQDPISSKPEQQLFVRYVHNLSPEEKSYDLGKVLKAFALETLAYKYKSTVEDSIKLSYSILQNSMESVKTPAGTPLINRFGENTQVKDNKNLIEQVEYAIDAWYGNRKALQGVSTKTVYTNKAKTKVNALTEALEQDKITKTVEEYIEEMWNSLTPWERLKIEQIEDEKDRLTTLGNVFLNKNARNVAGSKVGDVVLQYMQLKGMGFNVFSSVTNVIFGWFSNFNYAAGGVDFNLEQMLKANRIMLNSTSSSVGAATRTSIKINQMMIKFDVLKELNDAAYRSTTDTNRVRRGMSKIGPFELQRRGEYFVQGQTMVALALNTKVKVGEQEMTLWEAFDKPAFQENLDWNGNVDNKEHNKELYKFKYKLDQINKAIHGNYDPNSPVRIKKGILGRATMQFRSWVAEGFANRIESRKFDLLLGREREGRWRTYYSLGFKDSVKILARIAAGKDIDGLVDGEYKSTVLENMKRNLAEIYTKLTLLSLFFVFKALDLDDDDEWGKASVNFTLNQILRLQDDIEFYYSPLAIQNITQNFVPVFTLFKDGAKFVDALEKGIIDGEWEYRTGKKSGENRILWTGAKLFPFSSSTASLLNKTESEESFRK